MLPGHPALFQTREGDRVRCGLCPHGCALQEGKTGLCGVRRVVGGSLVSLVYGHPASAGVDPIEKKPLFHFLPGAPTFSYATFGCNLACAFCQNHTLSQVRGDPGKGRFVPPEAIVDAAAEEGSRVIAATWSEPTVFFEYALDVARLARARGMRNLFVTNGFMSPEALETVLPVLDAANVDLKAYSDETYRTVCTGRLEPVLATIRRMHESGVWVEVTTLVVPGMNDGEKELAGIAAFLASVSCDIPWHVSRFHPDYRMLDRSLTPSGSIELACRLGREAGLRHVYAGNLAAGPLENTFCPGCKALLIERHGFHVAQNRIAHSQCPDCGTRIAGVWTPAP
ncbi:MAG: AmmeMemoRadiSam system radical SAM enzyme [Deltaproteobacteria bacterium]|nr:AmmeMemoRadiSam system radical SAM enzyme [Deltaproteobacteria bacterium]